MSLFIVFLAYIIFYNKNADPKIIFWGTVFFSAFYFFLYLFIKFGRNLGKSEVKNFEIRYTAISFGIYLITALYFIYLHSIGIVRFSYEVSYMIPILGIALVILHDVYFYSLHYLLHIRFFYKHIHYVHHQSKDTNIMSGYSFHPIEAIMYMLVLGILFIMDLNIYAFLFALFMTDVITTVGHTGKEIFGEKFKKSIFFRVFTNASHHYHHHYKNNGNLAGYFIYLDKLFGTYNKEYEELFDKK